MALKNNILVPLGQYYTINWVTYKNKNLYLSVLKVGKSQDQDADIQCLVRGLLPGSWMVFLLGPRMQEGAKELSGASSVGVLS